MQSSGSKKMEGGREEGGGDGGWWLQSEGAATGLNKQKFEEEEHQVRGWKRMLGRAGNNKREKVEGGSQGQARRRGKKGGPAR